jgi:hypothetical protein
LDKGKQGCCIQIFLTQDFESSASEQLEYSVFGNDGILIDNPAIDYLEDLNFRVAIEVRMFKDFQEQFNMQLTQQFPRFDDAFKVVQEVGEGLL